MNNQIKEYYKLLDAFLVEQFKLAMGQTSFEAVSNLRRSIIAYLEQIKFKRADLESARLSNLNLFHGISSTLGFPELKQLPVDYNEGLKILESARSKLDSSSFLHELEAYSDFDFDENGIGLSVSMSKWLEEYDLKVSTAVSPDELKDILFDISGFESDFKYNFELSPEGAGFFMMTLNLQDTFFIGHRPPSTLFGLSTLAHEIGHTTTPRSGKDLISRFVDIDDDPLINKEVDSYRYEYLFAKNVKEVIAKLKIEVKTEDIESLLFKRKAIQYNHHLITAKLNRWYFSGLSIDLIQNRFIELIKVVHPFYQEENKLDWVNFASLARPVSKLGYLKAYREVF